MEQTKTYQQWLQEFKDHAATNGVVVDAEAHKDVLDLYWRENKLLPDTLDDYKKFVKRWNALQNHWY